MTVEKPKQILRPITTGADSAMNQSQFPAITCNSLEAREKSRVHCAIGFCFDSHWLKNWRESFKPIAKRSNSNYVITFDSHLKTALNRLRPIQNTAVHVVTFTKRFDLITSTGVVRHFRGSLISRLGDFFAFNRFR